MVAIIIGTLLFLIALALSLFSRSNWLHQASPEMGFTNNIFLFIVCLVLSAILGLCGLLTFFVGLTLHFFA